jgi:hypothetical protein
MKNSEIDVRLSELNRVCCASFAGEPADPHWLFDEAMDLIEKRPSGADITFWRGIVEAGRALNEMGEYAIGGELFEVVVGIAREIRFPRLEFDALEGLAFSWFYLGDQTRAIKYLEYGLELAIRLERPKAAERLRLAIDNLRPGQVRFPDNLKAPNTSPGRKSRWVHLSTLLNNGEGRRQ